MIITSTIKTYIAITKPGIILGNLITLSGGYFLAAQGNVNILFYFALLTGTALVIASGCVANNYIDRKIDLKMDRTNKRAIATGHINHISAILYAAVLFIIGTFILSYFTNKLVALLGIIGFISYVAMYGYAKRKTIHSTLIGSIPGAMPPVAGYVAVTHSLDITAMLLFIILVTWQIAHFYSIAIYRSNEYSKASLPLLPLIKGFETTKKHMVLYILSFIVAVTMLTVLSITSVTFIFVMLLVGIYWLLRATNRNHASNIIWAKGMFKTSLIVIIIFSFMLSIDNFLV